MATWGNAFKGAVLVLIYSIAWWIIGIIIIILGANIEPWIISIILGLIGVFLILFGAIASILKVASDI